MTANSQFSHLALAALSAIVLVLGAYAVQQETAGFLRGGDTSVKRVAAALDAGDPIGLSTLSQQATLLDCNTVLRWPNALEMRYQPDDARASMVAHCLTVSDAIASTAPTTSLAWLVGARAALQMGDTSGFNHRLLRSQLTSPTEQWLAEQRVELSEDNLSLLDEHTRTSHERDLAMLVSSLSGIYALTKRYLDDPAFRERIAAIVETLPEASQRRFISVLQRQVRQATND